MDLQPTLLPRLAMGLAALGLVGAACADVDTGPVTAPADAVADADENCHPEIRRALVAWHEAGFVGSIAFLDPDRPCVAAYGPADPTGPPTGAPLTPDTVFSIGSITKAVTAATVADLVADGALAYDDRVGDLLPGLGGPAAEATVGQLLVHTSGLTGSHGRDHEPLERDQAIAALSSLETVGTPGQSFAYSNAGFTLLALVIDEVTGDHRAHTATETLRTPDGEPIGGFWDGAPAAPRPRAVGVTEDGRVGEDGSFGGPHWALDGNGGVAMTPEELARWTTDLFTGRLVGPDAVDGLLGLRVDRGDGTAEIPGWVAVDEEAFGEPILGTSGGGGGIGHEMTVVWLPESERVYVIATNGPDVRAEELLQALLPDLVAGSELPRPAVAGAPGAELVAALTGEWVTSDGDRIRVVDEGDALAVEALTPGAVPLVLPVLDPADAADHERRVLEVVNGSTAEGRRERELLEDEQGPIDRIEAAGTWWAEFEYRTQLEVSFLDGERVDIWIALEGADAIAAAEVGVGPPSQRFRVGPDGSLVPVGAADADTGPRLAWDGMDLVITTDAGISVTASPVDRG